MLHDTRPCPPAAFATVAPHVVVVATNRPMMLPVVLLLLASLSTCVAQTRALAVIERCFPGKCSPPQRGIGWTPTVVGAVLRATVTCQGSFARGQRVKVLHESGSNEPHEMPPMSSHEGLSPQRLVSPTPVPSPSLPPHHHHPPTLPFWLKMSLSGSIQTKPVTMTPLPKKREV